MMDCREWFIFLLIILFAFIAFASLVQRQGFPEELTPEQQKLNMLKPLAKAKISELLRIARERWPEHKIVVAETYRTQARQDKLYAKGPDITTVRISKHTLGLAADIYFVNAQRILKYEEAPYLELGKMAESLGLTWGGRWVQPFDPGHFELNL